MLLTICSFITKLSQRIQMRSTTGAVNGQSDMEFFHKTFPYFIWLLRDVTKTIPRDCKDIKDYFLKKVRLKTNSFEGSKRFLCEMLNKSRFDTTLTSSI